MDLLVIVVNWNGENYISRCLESLYIAITHSKYNIGAVIIDNNSFDKSIKLISKYEFIDKIFLNDNIGFAAANNIALRKYKANYYLLLNPDTIISDKHNLDKILSFMGSNPKAGIAGCKIINSDNTWQPSIGHYYNIVNGTAEQTQLNKYLASHKSTKHFFNVISKIFPKILSHFNEKNHSGNNILDVDCILGSYFLIKMEVIKIYRIA